MRMAGDAHCGCFFHIDGASLSVGTYGDVAVMRADTAGAGRLTGMRHDRAAGYSAADNKI